jgi:predicted methyltransferase
MRTALPLLGLVLLAASPADARTDTIAAAVASPDRPATDTARDADRKPAALLAFAKIAPGERVADLIPGGGPGGGYFTRLFSKAVGPKGKVYAMVPAEVLARDPKAADAVNASAASPAFGNVTVLTIAKGQWAAPEPVDVAWTSDNYHDVYGFYSPAGAAQLDAAVFKMLKPGGEFIVVDHVAKAGATDAPTTLHRIDPAVVKAQVIAAGFVFEGESDALRNAADTHELKVFDPAIRGKTDQFVFKFRKPKG